MCTSAQRVCGGGGVAPQPRGAVWGPSLLSPGVPFSGGSLCTGFRRPCRHLVECVEPIIAGWALLVQTEPSQAVSPPVCALPHLVIRQVSPLDAFSSAGSFRSVLSEIGRGIPEQDGTPSRGELGRRQENRGHVSFRLAVMTLLKHLNRVFLVRGRKKKFVWSVCHWRVFAPLIVTAEQHLHSCTP